jgi:hypothetical protein
VLRTLGLGLGVLEALRRMLREVCNLVFLWPLVHQWYWDSTYFFEGMISPNIVLRAVLAYIDGVLEELIAEDCPMGFLDAHA